MKSNKWINTSKHLNVCRTMPPLKHKRGETFDINNSEVIKWLANHPEVLMYVFEVINGRDRKREQLIVFDREAGTWSGVDYHD